MKSAELEKQIMNRNKGNISGGHSMKKLIPVALRMAKSFGCSKCYCVNARFDD